MGGILFGRDRERALEFVPILCTVCDRLDPFLAFGGHEVSFLFDNWVDEHSVASVDHLMERLHENIYEWTAYYMDTELYDSIPRDALDTWATFNIECGGKGHLISCYSNPFLFDTEDGVGEKEERMQEVFNERILPLIRERILREYSLV